MTYITPFLTALGRKLPDIPIVMHDERFTSVLAHKAMIEGGAKKKQRQDKAIIDAISATIILQSYMESQRNLNIENAFTYLHLWTSGSSESVRRHHPGICGFE